MVYYFGRDVRHTITFESLDVGSSCTCGIGYLHGLWVEFVYEGRRVKIKVTGAKKVENSYSHNVKLRSTNSRSIKHRAVMFASSVGFSGTVLSREEGHQPGLALPQCRDRMNGSNAQGRGSLYELCVRVRLAVLARSG